MIEHCIAAFNNMQEEKIYRVYVTDALKALTGGKRRYYNIIDTTPKVECSYDEIMNSVWDNILGDSEGKNGT